MNVNICLGSVSTFCKKHSNFCKKHSNFCKKHS